MSGREDRKGTVMEFLVIQLIVMLICAFAAMAIAASKGRSQVAWFFGGLFLGVTGIIIVAVISNLKQEKAYREQAESERRRLREQLRQERIKSESYRQYSMTRIDVHDRLLGVDTHAAALPGAAPMPALPSDASAAANPDRILTPEEALANLTTQHQAAPPLATVPPQAGAWPPAAAPPLAFAPPIPMIPQVAWYYEIGGRPIGPVGEHDVRQLLRERRIDGRTLLWSEDLGEWTSAMEVDIFRAEAL
jgi:hypothetical protein